MRKVLTLFLFAASLRSPSALAAEKPTVNRRTGLFEPPASDLRKAADRGDRAELSRAATRLGPARLARLLADPDRKLVLAALEAAPLLESGVLLLQPMVPLLTSTDDAIRARAVTATGALFAQSDPSRLADYEVGSETVSAACEALAVAAADEKEQLGTRLSSLQSLVDGGPACARHRKLDVMLVSRDPDVRRAAVLATPEAMDARTQALLSAAGKDPDVRVAAAAAARLCRLGNAKHGALPPMHALVLSDAVFAEDVVDVLPCLAASADPADQKALAQLGDSGRPAIREAVKRLRESQSSRPIAETPPAKKP